MPHARNRPGRKAGEVENDGLRVALRREELRLMAEEMMALRMKLMAAAAAGVDEPGDLEGLRREMIDAGITDDGDA